MGSQVGDGPDGNKALVYPQNKPEMEEFLVVTRHVQNSKPLPSARLRQEKNKEKDCCKSITTGLQGVLQD